jgi:NitT/TauT family transport system ATP-binding protein
VTPRPGCIERTIDIDLPWPRDLEVRHSPPFAAYVRQIQDIFHRFGLM